MKKQNSQRKKDEPEVSPEMKKSDMVMKEDEEDTASFLATQQQQRKSEILQRQRQKNWDYFEIDHPKAISDKKTTTTQNQILEATNRRQFEFWRHCQHQRRKRRYHDIRYGWHRQ